MINGALKQVPQYPAYSVTENGEVYRTYYDHNRNIPAPKRMKTYLNRDGYEKLAICYHGVRSCVSVHTMVLLAFAGEPPPLHEGAHINGKRSDNRSCNLMWATPKVNHSHLKIHGTSVNGEKNGNSKLTVQQVMAIKQKLKDGLRITDIARLYLVTNATISAIKRGLCWQHISAPGEPQ